MNSKGVLGSLKGNQLVHVASTTHILFHTEQSLKDYSQRKSPKCVEWNVIHEQRREERRQQFFTSSHEKRQEYFNRRRQEKDASLAVR